jgi:hypothetical protein
MHVLPRLPEGVKDHIKSKVIAKVWLGMGSSHCDGTCVITCGVDTYCMILCCSGVTVFATTLIGCTSSSKRACSEPSWGGCSSAHRVLMAWHTCRVLTCV